MKSWEQTFDKVLQAVNHRVSKYGRPGEEHARSWLAEILAEEGIATMRWRIALGKTRKASPNVFEILYQQLGIPVPPAPKPKAPRVEADQVEETEAPAEPEAPPSENDVLYQLNTWLGHVPRESRGRVLAACAVANGIPGAFFLVESPARVDRESLRDMMPGIVEALRREGV